MNFFAGTGITFAYSRFMSELPLAVCSRLRDQIHDSNFVFISLVFAAEIRGDEDVSYIREVESLDGFLRWRARPLAAWRWEDAVSKETKIHHISPCS
jgi:hypothetical protein